jgi:hypothetical protein
VSTRRRRREPEWARLPDRELLELRFSDLGLRFQDTPYPRRLDRLYDELAAHGLRFRPHAWLSFDWFSPDGIPGIAVPFYLAHPRLMKLEDRQMLEVEGSNESWCMKLLRHEAGHAIDTAFRLHRKKEWRRLFGSFTRPYPGEYRPRPSSRRFVHHLDAWYAQSHPAEDFAETFAVWLRPGLRWRKRYEGWPAMKKLRYVDELMQSLAGTPAPVRSRRQVSPLSRLKLTLREYYERKRGHYMPDEPRVPDPDLMRLFARTGSRRRAATLLRRWRGRLREAVSRGTGEHPYTIDQVLKEMIHRCRELDLVVDRPEDQVRLEAAVLLGTWTTDYVHQSGHGWIPL